MKKQKIAWTAIVAATILGFVILVGFIVRLTRTDEPTSTTTLYVERDGQKLESGENISIEVGETVRFDVGYRLEFVTGQRGYYVKVAPRITEETEFTFDYDWATKKYSDIPSLTNAFNVVAEDGYFTICADGDMQEILSKLYASNVISDTPSVLNRDVSYFTLIVLSDDQTESVEFNLMLTGEVGSSSTITRVQITPGEIIF